jgi:hypothetical protein
MTKQLDYFYYQKKISEKCGVLNLIFASKKHQVIYTCIFKAEAGRSDSRF